MKNTYCSYCGSKFAEQILYPRRCFICYNDTFNPPAPVAVMLVNVWGEKLGKVGSLIQKRRRDPKKDQWSLSAGYMEMGETWEQTAARELQEELGLQTSPEDYSLFAVKTSPITGNVLIFGHLNFSVNIETVNKVFVPNEEVSEIKVVYEPTELGFPMHTEVLSNWFKGLPHD